MSIISDKGLEYTFCKKRGHELTLDSLYPTKSGYFTCKIGADFSEAFLIPEVKSFITDLLNGEKIKSYNRGFKAGFKANDKPLEIERGEYEKDDH